MRTHTTDDEDGVEFSSVDLAELLGVLDKLLSLVIGLELLALLVVLEHLDRVVVDWGSSACRASRDERDATLELVVGVSSLGEVPSDWLSV